MITRRKLLQFLGLGGAAAAVASKAEALALPAESATVTAGRKMAEAHALLVEAGAAPLLAFDPLAERTAEGVARSTVINMRTLVADERAGEEIAKAIKRATEELQRVPCTCGLTTCEGVRRPAPAMLAANEGDARAFYDEAPFFTLENVRTPDVTMQVYATDAEGVSHYARRPGDRPIGTIEGFGAEPGTAWVRINARDDASASLERGLGRLARASGEEREWAWLREQPAMRNWLDSVGPKLRADGVLRDDEDDEGGWVTHWKNPRA